METNNSLDLNILLANGGEEFINVDDFFSNYVAELSNRSKRQASQALEQALQPEGKHPRMDAMQPPLSPPETGFAPRPVPAFNAPGPMVGGMPPQQPFQQVPGGMNNITAQNIADLLHTSGQYSGMNAGPPGGLPRPMASAFDYDAQARAGGKSSKQQESNKVAQQRYRERKKQKFQEMEMTIAQLQQQLAQLQALQQHNQMLEGMNTELEKQLVGKERELERLKTALDAHSDASLEVSGMSDSYDGVNGDVTAAGGCPPGACNDGTGTASVCCDVLPRDLSGIDFKSGFDDQITKLRAFMQEHKLSEAEPSGADVDTNVMMALGQLVGRSCQLCQAAIRAEGVRVLDLIVTDPSQLSSIECDNTKSRYATALQAVKMTQEQQEQLLLLRRSHLEKMRTIYQERQGLNMEAMSLMLPHQSRNPYEDNTLEGRMANMSSGQYLPIAKSNAALNSVLDRIKDNLRQEQRAVMDLNCCLISKIMSPLQAALYMTSSYPQHCDALALSNVLAQTLNRLDDGAATSGGQVTASTMTISVAGFNGTGAMSMGGRGAVLQKVGSHNSTHQGGGALGPGVGLTR